MCGKCPHRGIDLKSINGDRKGNKICPAHGLKWNKQGQLVHKTQH
ncbi:Rieske 2Fe-2S domain-containing protein [[Phormidium ambiguum] IAM M-71]